MSYRFVPCKAFVMILHVHETIVSLSLEFATFAKYILFPFDFSDLPHKMSCIISVN